MNRSGSEMYMWSFVYGGFSVSTSIVSLEQWW